MLFLRSKARVPFILLFLLLILAIPSLAGNLPPIQTVFVILMENHDWSEIQGSPSAPYINNTLLPMASYCTQYYNPPNLHPSEPNYLWLEAGTNFGVTNDADPACNHQSSTNHLVTLLKNAGISWKSYVEDIPGGTLPLTSFGAYVAEHVPFLYFDDVTGTNNPNDPYGVAHVRPYTEFAGDAMTNHVASYNFFTPDICSDMHNDCTGDAIKQGDDWLAILVPGILGSQAWQNNGAIFILWDESIDGDHAIGMIVISKLAKGGGYSNAIHYTHSSTLRTIQEIFCVTPLLGDAANANDLGDLFLPAGGTNAACNSRITGFAFQPNGAFQVSFNAMMGVSYTLQASADLAHWTSVTNITAEATIPFQLADPAASTFPARYYRLSSP